MIPSKKATVNVDGIKNITESFDSFDSSFQGMKRLLVLAYDDKTNSDNTDANGRVNFDSYQKYFLPRVNIENYNIGIDGRNFYDQPINDPIKKNDEVRQTATGQGDDHTVGCLLHYAYLVKNYKLIAADLSKQKVPDADPRATQKIVFTGTLKTKLRTYYILEQSKETMLEFYKRTAKVL